MRALVVHNPGAGADDATHAELHHALIAAGHEVVYADVAAVASLPSTASEARADLVVVAGGDGTVGAALCALAGADVAVAVVPLGTANNIASSLGLAGLTPATSSRCTR